MPTPVIRKPITAGQTFAPFGGGVLQSRQPSFGDPAKARGQRVAALQHPAPAVVCDAEVLLAVAALAYALDQAAGGEHAGGGADGAAADLEYLGEPGGALFGRVADQESSDDTACDQGQPFVLEEHRDLVDEGQFPLCGFAHAATLQSLQS